LVVDDVGKSAYRPAWGALMAHVGSLDPRRRAQTMSWMSWGEDVGEVAGPILAGSIWGTWGIAAVLGVRVLLALGTEVYATVLMRGLGRRTVPKDRCAAVDGAVRASATRAPGLMRATSGRAGPSGRSLTPR
jgi:MFS family permease